MNIKSYRSPKTELRDSPIAGKGLFAIAQIAKDEIVGIKSGYIVDAKTVKENAEVINHSELQIADNAFIASMVESEFEDVMIFINHSCEPNTGLLGNILFVAMRDIQPGEEILNDYVMWESREDPEFACMCDVASCRKMVTGKDWMRKDLQEKYGKYMSIYLLEKLKNK